MNHNCPSPASRDRNADLSTLAVTVVKDRLGYSDRLNSHVAESPDLLVGYVQAALGLKVHIQWSLVTDDEAADVKVWQDYCCELYDAVEAHVLQKLMAA